MWKYLNKLNLKELFFPVVTAWQRINREIDMDAVCINNWELAHNEKEYTKVIKKIKEFKNSENQPSFIVLASSH